MNFISIYRFQFLIIFFFILISPHSFSKNRIVNLVSADFELYSLKDRDVLAIVPIKAQDKINDEILEKAKSELENTKLFTDIKIIPQLKNGKTTLLYKLKEARLVRKIEVSGHYPFLTKKIIRQSLFQSGERFFPKNIEESKQRIISFFENYGYFGTDVDIFTETDEINHVVNIQINIKKGNTYLVGKVQTNGNTLYSDSYIKNLFGTYSKFRPKKAKEKIKFLRQKYIDQGWVRARITLDDYKINSQTNKIDLFLTIEERKKIKINFEGNQWFRYITLKNQVTFYEERSLGRFSIERSVEKIKYLYSINGFLEANVDYKIKKEDNEKVITFIINEGKRTRLKKINLIGAKQVKPKKIIQNLASKEYSLSSQGLFNINNIPLDLELIKKNYRKLGFLDIQINRHEIILNEFKDMATLNIYLDEGPQYTLNDIEIIGNHYFSHKDIKKIIKLKKNKYIKSDKLRSVENKILDKYFEEGFAYLDLEIEKVIDKERHQINLNFIIDEGKKVKIGHILMKGLFHTKKSTILNNLKFKEGDFYIHEKILEAQLNLKKLGIFNYVQIIPVGVNDQNKIIDLVIKVEERKRHTLDLQAGFDSDKLVSSQLLFTKRNLFGKAKKFQARAIGGFELSRGELTLFHPKVFYASWNLYQQIFIEYEDDENYNAFSYGGSMGVSKPFGNHFTLILKNEISRFNIFENESNQDALNQNLFDNTFLEFESGFIFDTRDNFSDPQRGIYAKLSSEINTDLSDTTNNFLISEVNLSAYLNILPRTVFIQTFRLGKLNRINENARIPVNKLFFLGGNDTIRGFDEDAVNSNGGTTSLLLNTELQIRIMGGFKLASFLDVGSLTETFSEIEKSSFRESAGVGIRYITPIGPIRLDYGFVLDARQGEQDKRFHFSFGYFF